MHAKEQLAVGVEEAARMAGIGRTEAYRAIKDGRLPSLKIGKRRLVRVEALGAWLRALERSAVERRATS
jgi:excisionase family DNA binding protein